MIIKKVKNRNEEYCYVCGETIPEKTGAVVFSPRLIGRVFVCIGHTEEEIIGKIYKNNHGRSGYFKIRADIEKAID